MYSLSSLSAAASAGFSPRSEPFGSFRLSCSATCCPDIAPMGRAAARVAPGDVRATIRRVPKATMLLRRQYCLDELNSATGIDAAVKWIKLPFPGSTAAGAAARHPGCPSVARPCSSERSATAAREAVRVVGRFPAPHIRLLAASPSATVGRMLPPAATVTSPSEAVAVGFATLPRRSLGRSLGHLRSPCAGAAATVVAPPMR